jgi:hypothetical protein
VDSEAASRRPNLVLIGKRHAKGWGRGRAAKELRRLWNENFSGAPAAESIVKSIRRHETGEVQVRDEVYRKLYCLAYGSSPQELFGAVESVWDTGETFDVTSHKFIPCYIGVAAASRLTGGADPRSNAGQWLDCRAYVMDVQGVTLYVWPFGVVVFHVVEELAPSSLAALAVWRQESYRCHLESATSRIRSLSGNSDVAASYVFSLYWVAKPIWTGPVLETALRILSMPKVLLERDQETENERAELIERVLLAEGFDHPEAASFGIRGISVGFASWSGVVYHPVAPERALTEWELVSAELATQALWAYCAHINGEVEQGRDPGIQSGFGWRFLRAARSRLANARPQETGQHRSMRNAILATSGLVDHLTHAIEALRESNGG